MAYYFIFNLENALYKIAESDEEKNYVIPTLAVDQFKAVSVSSNDFNSVKKIEKEPVYNGSAISFRECAIDYATSADMKNYRDIKVKNISGWLDNNPTHPYFSKWNNYKNTLNNLNIDNIFSNLQQSNPWYGYQIHGPNGTGYSTEADLQTAIDQGIVTPAQITRVPTVGVSLEKYLDLTGSSYNNILQLPC